MPVIPLIDFHLSNDRRTVLLDDGHEIAARHALKLVEGQFIRSKPATDDVEQTRQCCIKGKPDASVYCLGAL
jgi:hypothetical protein